MSKIKVLIVDDSPFVCKALKRILESDPAIEVAGIARDGREAIEKVIALSPDVVTLDIMMPGMDGIQTLREINQINPVPVLMLSQYTQEGAELTLTALELGAMDFIDKSSKGLMDFYELAHDIIIKIKTIAGKTPVTITPSHKTLHATKGKARVDMVAIGASTGGPSALQTLLLNFPKDIDFALLIVQHMPSGFTEPLARRLDRTCNIRVKEAKDREKILPGHALIAPAGYHMSIRKTRHTVKLAREPEDTPHRPSVNVLFTSVARNYGERSMGVILTGMGSDGSDGLQDIKRQGGIIFAQDKATSTIFGMPRAAIETGKVDKIVPITSLAEEIMKMIYR